MNISKKSLKIASVLFLTAVNFMQAQTMQTWTGAAGDNNWNNAANWDGGRVPTVGSGATAVQISRARVNVTTDVSGFDGMLVTSGGASLNVSGNVTFSALHGAWGSFTVSNGATIDARSSGIAIGFGEAGFLDISGRGSRVMVSSLQNFSGGCMEINLYDGGVIDMNSAGESGGTILLGSERLQSSVLNIGKGGAAGTLINVGTIYAGSVDNAGASGQINFNHNESGYIFSAYIMDYTGPNEQINVTHLGTGTTIFTADQYRHGTTTVSNGVLQLGDGGTSGSITGKITLNGGTLAYNRSDNINLAEGTVGVITGTGTIRQSGTGILTVEANVAWNVGASFEISSGTLKYTSNSGVTIFNETRILSGASNAVLDVSDVNIVNMGSFIVGGDAALLLETRHGNNNLFTVGTLTIASGQTLTLAVETLNLQFGDLYAYGVGGVDLAYDLLQVNSWDLNGTVDVSGLNASFTDNSDNIWNLQGVEWNGVDKFVAVYSMESPIPEPSSYALLFGTGMLATVVSRRRRK